MINGLHYLSDFLAPNQEDDLLAAIDREPWLDDLKRRVQHYGYKYDYRARSVDLEMYLGALPEWAQNVSNRLQSNGWFKVQPDQLIVNEYQPGQGIAPHIDCEPCFADTIASVTLGSGCSMDFTRLADATKKSMYLEPRSIVVLTGEARYDWKHSIAPRKSDPVDGLRVVRARRVSLTFRNVLLKAAEA